MRAADVLDRELLGSRQREELAGDGEEAALQFVGNSVADQVEESDLVGGLAQLSAELLGGVGVLRKRQIEHWQRRNRHGVLDPCDGSDVHHSTLSGTRTRTAIRQPQA